jgi:hypothetical protein
MRRTLAFFDADGNPVGAPLFVGSSIYTALRSGQGVPLILIMRHVFPAIAA